MHRSAFPLRAAVKLKTAVCHQRRGSWRCRYSEVSGGREKPEDCILHWTVHKSRTSISIGSTTAVDVFVAPSSFEDFFPAWKLVPVMLDILIQTFYLLTCECAGSQKTLPLVLVFCTLLCISLHYLTWGTLSGKSDELQESQFEVWSCRRYLWVLLLL